MKIITCASYYSTGSSAITDLIGECDNVCYLGDYEFRFIQDPDGVRDLEYNLVENNHRHNSGNAIKRYEKMVKFWNGNKLIKKYNKYFDDKFILFSKEYVAKLVGLKYKGFWHQDLIERGKIFYYIERTIQKILHKIFHVHSEKTYFSIMRNTYNYATYPGENFYKYTKEYVDRLFDYANKNKKAFIMVDQLVPASNTMHYVRFFNNVKVICVDRDPRDLYLLEKCFYHGTIIPCDSPNAFCTWYKLTRKHKEFERDDENIILRINFEDLIYKYEETKKRIFDFCGIDIKNHVYKFLNFDPSKSIKNTKLFERFPQYKEDIKYIEKNLFEALYVFPKNNI